MTKQVSLSRRHFFIGSAAAGGGLAIGIGLPGGRKALAQKAAAGTTGDEVGAWVMIRPNDDEAIRGEVLNEPSIEDIFAPPPM